jgi:hypothetical protein
MRKFSVAIAGIALGTSFGIATPARATSTVAISSPCDSLTDGDAQGCKFTGNIDTNTNGNSSYLLAQTAYNAAFNPDITLTPLADLDVNGGTMNGITITKTATGVYDLSVAAGINLSYFAVKAGNDFILYQYIGQTSFTTDGLQSGRSHNLPGLSHAVFFGTAGGVPEPATWAMMLLGFGMMGASVRRRRAKPMLQAA